MSHFEFRPKVLGPQFTKDYFSLIVIEVQETWFGCYCTNMSLTKHLTNNTWKKLNSSVNFAKQLYAIALRHGCSPLNLLHSFRTSFLENTSGWLLLYALLILECRVQYNNIFWASFWKICFEFNVCNNERFCWSETKSLLFFLIIYHGFSSLFQIIYIVLRPSSGFYTKGVKWNNWI